MKNSVIAIPSSYVVITTIVYALLYPKFLEMDTAFGEQQEVNFVVNNENEKTMAYSQ